MNVLKGLDQTRDGATYLGDNIVLDVPCTKESMVDAIDELLRAFPETRKQIAVADVACCKGIMFNDWVLFLNDDSLRIDTYMGVLKSKYSPIPYEQIAKIEFDLFLNGRRLVSIWITQTNGFMLRLL